MTCQLPKGHCFLFIHFLVYTKDKQSHVHYSKIMSKYLANYHFGWNSSLKGHKIGRRLKNTSFKVVKLVKLCSGQNLVTFIYFSWLLIDGVPAGVIRSTSNPMNQTCCSEVHQQNSAVPSPLNWLTEWSGPARLHTFTPDEAETVAINQPVWIWISNRGHFPLRNQ